jgi:hypothetical protein
MIYLTKYLVIDYVCEYPNLAESSKNVYKSFSELYEDTKTYVYYPITNSIRRCSPYFMQITITLIINY